MLLRKKSTDAEAIVPPEQDPNVIAAGLRVSELASKLSQADAELAAAERTYAQVQIVAADALLNEEVPPSLLTYREQISLAAEKQYLLGLALATAKTRCEEALDAAKDQQWRLRWQRFQADVNALDKALALAFQAQQVAMASWNAAGQPNDPPLLKGPLAVWESDFHQYLVELAATSAEHVQRGAMVTSGGQPRLY